MEYKIVEAKSSLDLKTSVDAALKDGWRLQGGVSVANKGGVGMLFAQALVK